MTSKGRAARHAAGKNISRAMLAIVLAAMAPAVGHAAPAASLVPPAGPLKDRIAQLASILKGTGDYDAYFAPAFTAQVPQSKFAEISAQLGATLGAPVGVEQVTATSPYAAELKFGFERGVADMRIAVSEQAPHQAVGLLITGYSAREASLDAILETMKGLPGSTGFALAQLGPGAPRLLNSHNADRPLALGSAFKLVILAELVRQTNDGRAKWTDSVTLDGAPLPGGAYTQMPAGTKVSLQELAGKMISVSDNSATDILLRHLGRKSIEAMLPKVGIARPGGMRPFLSTLEAFKLKGIAGGLAHDYLRANEAGRRALLDGAVAAQPLSAISPTLFKDGKPVMIDTIEWFASPADMVRVMDWLRRNTDKNATARSILSQNPGVGPGAASKWRYVGFKGGSEPGVMNMTLLLQDKAGGWYAMSAGWNNPAADVDQGRFAGLVSRSAELAAPQP